MTKGTLVHTRLHVKHSLASSATAAATLADGCIASRPLFKGAVAAHVAHQAGTACRGNPRSFKNQQRSTSATSSRGRSTFQGCTLAYKQLTSHSILRHSRFELLECHSLWVHAQEGAQVVFELLRHSIFNRVGTPDRGPTAAVAVAKSVTATVTAAVMAAAMLTAAAAATAAMPLATTVAAAGAAAAAAAAADTGGNAINRIAPDRFQLLHWLTAHTSHGNVRRRRGPTRGPLSMAGDLAALLRRLQLASSLLLICRPAELDDPRLSCGCSGGGLPAGSWGGQPWPHSAAVLALRAHTLLLRGRRRWRWTRR